MLKDAPLLGEGVINAECLETAIYVRPELADRVICGADICLVERMIIDVLNLYPTAWMKVPEGLIQNMFQSLTANSISRAWM